MHWGVRVHGHHHEYLIDDVRLRLAGLVILEAVKDLEVLDLLLVVLPSLAVTYSMTSIVASRRPSGAVRVLNTLASASKWFTAASRITRCT